MAHKVFLSPSDQTKNTYAWGNTNEAEQCGKIGHATQDALKRCGFETMLVQYEPMSSKCAKSDAFGAELHVPIHSNGFNKKVTGTRIFCYSMGGEGYKACKAIFDELAPLTPGISEDISAQPQLYETRVPTAPTAYIEVDFHDVDYIAEWIISHTTEIAEAIAKGICNYFGAQYIAPKSEDKQTEEEDEAMRMQTINDVPDWAKKETQELIDAGALRGSEKGLDLTEDMLRAIIICKRYIESRSK